MHCDHTVYVTADLSLWLDSPVLWAPWHQSMSTYSQSSFPVPAGREVEYMDVQTIGMISQERLKIEVKLLLNANRKAYMPRRLAQQRKTLNGRFTHRALSLR